MHFLLFSFTLALLCYFSSSNGNEQLLGEIRGVMKSEEYKKDQNSVLFEWALEKGCQTISNASVIQIKEFAQEMDEIKQIVEQICAKKGINEQGIRILGQKVLDQLKVSEKKQPKVPLENFGTQLMQLAKGLPDELPVKSAVIKQLEPINGSLATPNDAFKFLNGMVSSTLNNSDSAKKQVNSQKNLIVLKNSSARRRRRFDRRKLPIVLVIQVLLVFAIMLQKPILVFIACSIFFIFLPFLLQIRDDIE